MLLRALFALCLVANVTLAADVVDTPRDTDDMRLLRFPDIHGDTIVFGYGGDLWTVSANGGQARHLTTSPGYESQPKFSPDGQTIAFSGAYDGNNDVYTIPTIGGEPTRLTWHPGGDRVIDWQPDGQAVRFQSRRESRTGRDRQLFTVARGGGLPQRLALPTGGLSSYAPDGQRIAYNRITREQRTWKRYKGGMAQDIWLYDFATQTSTRATTWEGSDNFPMWHGTNIYYTSDQTGRLQIWCYDTTDQTQRQITHHREYDVKNPSLGPDNIVYENGGWLYVLDLATEKTHRVKVSLHSDNVLTRPRLESVSRMVGSGALAPDAQRAVFDARGDIFTVPAEKGNVRNLTATPGIRERGAVWSPDGQTIAYLSDATGEYEIWLQDADGKSPARQLTHQSKTYKLHLTWSPDSKHLVVNDAAMNLWLVDAGDGDLSRVDQSLSGEINQWGWSPHSGWLAYAKSGENGFRSIWLYELANGKSHRVTTDFTDEASPCFDEAGQYLFFTSAQHFQPTLGGYDLKPMWTDMDGLYLVTLRQDVPHPFPPESDEVAAKKDDTEDDGDEDDDKDKDAGDESDEPLVIDLVGITSRMVPLDVAAGGYGNLRSSGTKLFFVSAPFHGAEPAIKLYDLKEREEKTVLAKTRAFDLSFDGKKLLYTAGNQQVGIVKAEADQKPAEKPLRLDEMTARIDPRAEWREMFRDAWRQERDFFYDPGMHGVDWEHMYDRYGQLVPYVAHGLDFSYLVGEMIGELSSSHSYVRPGDIHHAKRVAAGLLGCTFHLDQDAKRYQLGRIYTQVDWNAGTPAPLHLPGQDISPDDYIISIDGVELSPPRNPYSLLDNKVGQQVVLKIAPNAKGKNSREITVIPIASDATLRYEAWVQDNRQRVDTLSGGKIGYLHLPNTAVGGQIGFAKGYYPNLRKEGLIIDERFNGGGFIPDFFMNIMRQKLVNMWKPRYGQDWRTPGSAFLGHLAMISNGYAGSGGDALPYYFKYYELGDVIGTRTWGGLIGISRGIRLMDGGAVTCPEFGLFNVNGEWDVENHGVEPTIPLDNLPEREIAGRDPQLEKAVEVLLQQIAGEPVQAPHPGAFPRNKTR